MDNNNLNNPNDPSGQDWVGDVKTEVSAMAKEGMHHPSTKPVLTGAAVGAVAGLVLPIIGPVIGGFAGAGVVLYNRLKK